MKSRYIFTALAIAACSYLIVSHRNVGSADETPQKDMYFKTRFILATAYEQTGAYLENPELRMMGARSYLVGKAAPVNERWELVAGKTMWVPLEVVTQIVEFNSIDEIKSAAAGFENRKPSKDFHN
jgi:hypothetical protein